MLAHDRQLQTWAMTSGLSTVTFVEAKVSHEGHEDSAPSSEDFAMAHLGMVYWATCILLYNNLCQLAGDSRMQLPERINPRQYFRKIALLMPYVQGPGMGAFFMNIAAFPTIVAMNFLVQQDLADHPSEERDMLLKSVGVKHGHDLGKVLEIWAQQTVVRRKLSDAETPT